MAAGGTGSGKDYPQMTQPALAIGRPGMSADESDALQKSLLFKDQDSDFYLRKSA
jgi:hypothetical protein